MALYTASQGSSVSAAPAYGMVCSHSSMAVSGHGPAMYAENFYGQWVCTHCPNGAQGQHVCGQYSSTQSGQRNGVWPPACDLKFGTYFPAGGSSPESSRRRSRPAVLLAVHCVSEKPTASYGVRPAETGAPGCRAGMRSLRSDQPRARTAYCAVRVYPAVRTPTITNDTTGANGAGPWECTAGVTPAPTRTRDR